MQCPKKLSTVVHDVRHSPGWDPEDWKRFVELPYFTAKWRALGLGDEDLRALQIMLTAAPTHAPVIRGTGGLRKIRFARGGSKRGKSGSYRIGYVYFEEYGVICLITVYAKNDEADIPMGQRAEIKKAIRRLWEWVSNGG